MPRAARSSSNHTRMLEHVFMGIHRSGTSFITREFVALIWYPIRKERTKWKSGQWISFPTLGLAVPFAEQVSFTKSYTHVLIPSYIGGPGASTSDLKMAIKYKKATAPCILHEQPSERLDIICTLSLCISAASFSPLRSTRQQLCLHGTYLKNTNTLLSSVSMVSTAVMWANT